jgi:D-3-phosphoglycerate dehydrogenase
MLRFVMADTLTPLILDLLEAIATSLRPYAEVMDAWRTSCPRLPVWEEANARGFVVHCRGADQELLVDVTPLGRQFLH